MNRRLTLCVLLGALASGCASDASVGMWPAPPVHWQPLPEASSASSPVTPTDHERSLAAAYTSALTSQGFVELGPMLDEEAQFAFGARTTHGRGRVLKGHEDLFGAFGQRHFVMTRVWLTDSTHPLDSQAIEWTMTGVHTGPFLGVAATLKPVVIKGLTLLWTSDLGVISELHVYFDEELVKAQLGAGPAELQGVPVAAPAAGSTVVVEHAGSPEEATNVATLRSMLRALEDGQEPEFLSTMADDVDVFTLDSAEALHGKDAARAYFRNTRKSIRLLDTVVQNAWGMHSFVILEYAITGLQVAPIPRIGFTANHPLHTQFVDIAELHDGKIARLWRYADPLAFSLPITVSAVTRPDAELQSRASRLKGARP